MTTLDITTRAQRVAKRVTSGSTLTVDRTDLCRWAGTKGEGRRGRDANRIKKGYLRVPAPHDECDRAVLPTQMQIEMVAVSNNMYE